MFRDAAIKNKQIQSSRYWKEYWQIYVLMIPAILAVGLFCYYPMYGAQIAFRDFRFKRGIWGSEWVGLEYFFRWVGAVNFWPLMRNTFLISLYSLIAGFPAPIILAFMLNELRNKTFKRAVQMLTYIPHFMSTVCVVGIILMLLRPEYGVINLVLVALGGKSINFIADPAYFRTIYIVSGIWQGVGWGTIIYLAALSSVDPQIIEASIIDGANRLQKIAYIDFPSILPTIIILLILRCGSLLSVGYEKIYLLQNNLNMDTADVISTYVYRIGILDAQYSYTTAIGLFNSLINVMLLTLVNAFVRRLKGTSIW
jgi:putative aldouronate transport system permease protein